MRLRTRLTNALVVGILALGVTAMATRRAEASSIVINGTINGHSEVDWIFFTADTGLDSINVWAWDPLNGQELDSFIYLFEDDGSTGPLTGALLGVNDDSSAPGWDADGSTDTRDSFLSNLNLPAGNYVLAIGDYFLDETEARTGLNDLDASATGDYRVTITTSAVPEPGTLSLFAIGLAGLGRMARQRRNSGPR